jgi:hypothetical protein
MAPAPHGASPARISCCPACGWAAPSPSQSVARQGRPLRTIIGLGGRQSLPELACNDHGRAGKQDRVGQGMTWRGRATGRVTVQRWRSALTTGGFLAPFGLIMSAFAGRQRELAEYSQSSTAFNVATCAPTAVWCVASTASANQMGGSRASTAQDLGSEWIPTVELRSPVRLFHRYSAAESLQRHRCELAMCLCTSTASLGAPLRPSRWMVHRGLDWPVIRHDGCSLWLSPMSVIAV